jgi:hypothetical protein
MKLKSILEKMNLMRKQTISTGLPLSALVQGSVSISEVKASEKETSDEETRDCVSHDTQHYINEYAKFAFAFSDHVLEELESEAHDPYWQAQIESIIARREALQVALAKYNERCEEENSPRSASF